MLDQSYTVSLLSSGAGHVAPGEVFSTMFLQAAHQIARRSSGKGAKTCPPKPPRGNE